MSGKLHLQFLVKYKDRFNPAKITVKKQ